MARQQILMPKLGLTMTEGTLYEWKVAPGERVRQGDVLFVVETDKTTNDVEASADGVVEALHVAGGTVVGVGVVVATLITDQDAIHGL
jgi:pyruvate dehydrogenase E2 component (dihydrolipoamide acetyltransferase)